MIAGDGGTVSPSSGFRNAGSVVAITATQDPGFTFTGWNGSGSGSYTGPNNPASVTMNGPIVETGLFSAMLTITVETNPVGRSFTVDGTTYNSTQIFNWLSGSSHSLSSTSPQAGTPGTQYVWTQWSDGGALSHSISPASNTTYTATFQTQYELTMTAGAGGTAGPGTGFHDAGATVEITATADSGFVFAGWTGTGAGSYSGATNPVSISMQGPITEVADFTAPTDANAAEALPTEFALAPPHPNPAIDRTTLSFSLPHGGSTTLRIFDVTGRVIASLVEQEMPAGNHSREWVVNWSRQSNGRVGSGVYFVRLECGTFAETRKMIVAR
jgi:hypothetical protein